MIRVRQFDGRIMDEINSRRKTKNWMKKGSLKICKVLRVDPRLIFDGRLAKVFKNLGGRDLYSHVMVGAKWNRGSAT